MDDSKVPACESDPSPIHYYEFYPNLSTGTGTGTGTITDDNKDQPCQSDPSPICYYEFYPNLSTGTGTGTSTVDNKGQPCHSDTSPICYYECYPNESNTTSTITSSTKKSQQQSESQSTSSSKNPITELNFLGLPIRPGKKKCPYYMRNGSCKYEADCKFNHPDPTAEVDFDVLKKPLSPATYKDYFAALLYAEELYIEKWSKFQLLDVTLEFRESSIYDKSPQNKNLKKGAEEVEEIFVALKIDSIPERRPFVLSRDFVFARRSGSEVKKFHGIVFRVVESNLVLVKFDEEFYSQYDRNCKYDVSFSFNRIWLERARLAISAAVSGPFLEKYLFPEHAIRENICSSSSASCAYSNDKLDSDSNSAIRQILSFKGHPPYLVEGPLCASDKQKLSKTGLVVREAVFQIYQRFSTCRILICFPVNNTGDILLGSLKSEILESVVFRANIAFGEVDEIPGNILPSYGYEGKRSAFPSLEQLKQFRVIFSTYVSSFGLFKEGITARHFSHIFLVDASSVTEPEIMIPLSHLANENTTVVLTGTPNNQSTWVRSDIARKNGLKTSYFERLRATKIYESCDPAFIMQL